MIEGKRKSLIHNSLGGQWKGNEIGIKPISFSLNFLVDTSISIDSFEDYKIQDFSDFLKELGTNWKTPINKGEYILNYKGFNDQIYTFRGSTNSVHNLFDLHDSLQIHNFMTKDRGLSIGGQIQPTYKGKALTPDIIEKIETILDTLLN